MLSLRSVITNSETVDGAFDLCIEVLNKISDIDNFDKSKKFINGNIKFFNSWGKDPFQIQVKKNKGGETIIIIFSNSQEVIDRISQCISEPNNESIVWNKSGKTKKGKIISIVSIIAIMVIFAISNSSTPSPIGKSWMSSDGWEEYSFGNNFGQSDDYLSYTNQILDYYGRPVRNIYRTGTFTYEGNKINCKFNDGEGPYQLEYKKVNGVWSILDERGNVFIYDNPNNRR